MPISPELVFDHGNTQTVLLAQDTIEQRRLAAPKKPVSTVTGYTCVSM